MSINLKGHMAKKKSNFFLYCKHQDNRGRKHSVMYLVRQTSKGLHNEFNN